MLPVINNDIVVNKELSVTEDSACLEMAQDFESNKTLVTRVCRNPEFCNTNVCFRRCCTEYEFVHQLSNFTREVKCKPIIFDEVYTTRLMEFHKVLAKANQTSTAFDTINDYGILIGLPCKKMGRVIVKWSLTSEGPILAEKFKIQNKYCMNFSESQINDSLLDLFICTDILLKYGILRNMENELHFSVNADRWPALHFISCVCLLMTLLVYAYLPNLQNLHGKILMCYMICDLLTFTCVYVCELTFGLAIEEDTIARKALGLYMGVLIFVTLRVNITTKTFTNRKKFILYSLYAWSFSFLILIPAIIIENMNNSPDYLYLNVDIYMPTYAFPLYGILIFNGPKFIMLISNIVFFILTTKYYNKVKVEMKRITMDSMNPRIKQFYFERKTYFLAFILLFLLNFYKSFKFILFFDRFVSIKLFIVMGIFWSCENVLFYIKFDLVKKSSSDKSFAYWVIDMLTNVFYVVNAFQGLYIFIIFVMKKRVYQALRTRLGL
ncbi:probable G-protein coupled receptor Mth-like 10 [Monomorium pharaonis]|uniref:probable G-protein coupled receptor Mth-like 10 n=1 Tax=Monomorium pharaonis TaxID=307658 RepID=UPI00174630D9|nr:probable G-protein coupled receptor Mth-like 10 [Monomorium pharaonis]